MKEALPAWRMGRYNGSISSGASVFVLSSGSLGPIAIIAVNPNQYEGPSAMQEDFSCKEAA